jgi:hypothetical protein
MWDLLYSCFLIELFSQKNILFPLSFVWTAASAVGKIPTPLFAFNGKPEVNKTNIKKNAKYLVLRNIIIT